MLLKVHTTGGTVESGWDGADFRDAGTLIADLTDWDTSSSSGWAVEQVTPFAKFTYSSALTDQAHHGVEELPWDGFNWARASDGDASPIYDLIGPGSEIGNSFLIKVAAAFSSDFDTDFDVEGAAGTYDNTNQATPITPTAPLELTATAVDDGSGNARLRFSLDYATGSDRLYLSWFTVTESASTLTITSVDGDNAVTQYQQPVTIALSDFTETITSVTINGTACAIDSQVVGTSVDVIIPGTLTAGTYDVVVSGATETATLTGVSYTQTHARPAFDGLVDSNSILSGQSYTADSYFRFVTSFSNGTLDTAAGDAAEWAGDIADYYTPDGGFTGDDTASIEFLYSDGTTSETVGVTVTVEEEVVQAPQGTITIGTITKDDSSASIPFAYSDTDQDSFEYSMNGGTSWDTVTSPISLTGLNDGELYSGLVRPVNSAGTGTSAGFSFTTDSLPDSWPFSKGIRYAASKTWSWGKRHPVTGMRVRMYK